MPILEVQGTSLDAILNEISFVLPDFSAEKIDVADLMTFDQTDLPGQFQRDLLLSCFFSLLETDLQRRVSLKKHEENELEVDLLTEYREAASSSGTKITETQLKQDVQRSQKLRTAQREIITMQQKLSSVGVMVTMLNRKAVALNVLTAKIRTELGAGLQH